MRTPRLTAGYAIGSALGHYRAASVGYGGGASLTSMACGPGEIECPPESNQCCTADQWCYQLPDGTYACLAPPLNASASSPNTVVRAPGPPVATRTGG